VLKPENGLKIDSWSQTEKFYFKSDARREAEKTVQSGNVFKQRVIDLQKENERARMRLINNHTRNL
jgi:hypothetical protein